MHFWQKAPGVNGLKINHLILILFVLSLGSLAHDDFAEMHLHPNPVFTIPSDNIYMTCMTGTQSGRIFLGGKDGCVYEVAYQVRMKGRMANSCTLYT